MGDENRPDKDGQRGGKDRSGKGGRRHWRRKKNRYNKKRTPPNCAICGTAVRDVLTAIAYGEEKSAAHFDCVMKELGERENLEPKEKLVYLGGGTFGVVKMKGGGGKFQVLRKIPFEDREITPEWRIRASERQRKLSRVNLPNLRTSVEINARAEDEDDSDTTDSLTEPLGPDSDTSDGEQSRA